MSYQHQLAVTNNHRSTWNALNNRYIPFSASRLTSISKTNEEDDLLRDEKGMTRLHHFCQDNHIWLAKSFLERRSSELITKILTIEDLKGQLSLRYAVINGSRNFVELLLDNFKLESTVLVAYQDFERRTPLHTAAQNGHVDLIKPIVYAHVNPAKYLNMQNKNSLTARDLAWKCGKNTATAELARLEQPANIIKE